MQRIIYLLIVVICSCGPSVEEQAKIQAAKEDSIKKAAEERMKRIFSLREAIENESTYRKQMEKQLSLAKAELEVQREKLNTIKEFQFLRTAEEKDNQIRNQVLVIEKQEKEIEKPYKNLNEQEEDLRKMMGELRMLEGE